MKNEKFSQLVDQLSAAQRIDSAKTKATIEQVLTTSGVQIKQRHHRVIWTFVSLVAAICVLTLSGMTITPVNHVMAQAPIIGNFFAKFDDDLGTIVETNGKSQKLNVTRTSSGMKVVLNSAYVQGKEVAITGTIDGLDKPKDDWFDFYLGRNGVKFSQDSMDMTKIANGRYRFYLNGQIKGAVPKNTINFPIVFTSFKGNFGRWAFNLHLTPSKVSSRKLNGKLTVANGDVKLKLLGIDEYAGGTGLLKIQQTKKFAKDEFTIFNVNVNNSKQNYLLANYDPIIISGSGKQQVVGYRVKKMPKNIKKIKIEPSLGKIETSQRTTLSSLPLTIRAKRTSEVFKFKKASLKSGKLTLRYYLTGTGSTDHQLISHNGNALAAINIMAKTYHDNGNDSVFGNDYLDQGNHRLINTKTHEFESTYDLSQKSGLKKLKLSQLQLQIDYEGLHAVPKMKLQIIQVKQR